MIPSYLAIFGERSPELEALVAREEQRHAGIRRLASNSQFLVSATECLEARQIDGGYVFGSLFSNAGTRIDDFRSVQVHGLIADRGATLVDQFWGSYVAIWPDPDGAAHHVLRAPTGSLGCYWCRHDDVTAVSNDVDLLGRIGLVAGVVDWNVIATHLRYDHLRVPQTAVEGVTELVGGTRITWKSGRLGEVALWSPWDFTGRQEEVHCLSSAVELVAQTTRRVTSSLAAQYGHVLLGVSGGLDSSIVAACLSEAGVRMTCFTLVSDDGGGDERSYARALTECISTKLVELHEDPSLIDIRQCAASHLPRPVARAFAQSGDKLQQALATDVGADAYFSGAGGDNVFAYIPSVSPVSDRLRREGFGTSAVQTARALSIMTGVGIPRIMAGAMRRAWVRRPAYRWPTQDRYLSEEAATLSLEPASNPWLRAPRGAIPGKAAHIAWLVGIQNHLEGYSRELDRPLVAPLLAQPLVEVCLRIPTWLWVQGGRNRVIARLAFEPVLPEMIAQRRTKGSPDGFVTHVFETHRQSIREILLDGALARQRIVDHRALEASLSSPSISHDEVDRLMTLVDVEAWIDAWRRKAGDA